MNIISHKSSNLSIDHLIQSKRDSFLSTNFENFEYKNKAEILFEELIKSELGQFILEHKGFNAYWTEYVCSYPDYKKQGKKIPSNLFELFVLEKSLLGRATQERYQIFKQVIQKYFKNGVRFASLPCGLMSDFLLLDCTGIEDFKFIGLDLDNIALEQAKANALIKGLQQYCEFYQVDAWKIEFYKKFDLMVSNGLNIYEQDDNKIISLYQRFFESLNNTGVLIVSTITPSPLESNESSWNMNLINQEDLHLQKIIFQDILEVKFQARRSIQKTIEQLKEARFSEFEILPDSLGMFVTIIAHK